MRVLVCGGRDFKNYDLLNRTMDRLHQYHIFTTVIEGGARGADRLARMWASRNRLIVETYEADWDKYRKAAGVIRNTRMLDEGSPEIVVAFPGGRGTANMVDQAKARWLPIVEVSGAMQ